MAYECKIVCDSISPSGIRLTTFEITFPRIVLAEFNTHRMFSRNSASSRAIPVEKQIKKVLEDPFIPFYWGKNQKGMQADQELTGEEQQEARWNWIIAKDLAVSTTQRLVRLGVHKQITNRLLEPFLWHTCIVTATEWNNFFNLRCHYAAAPEIRRIAEMMKEAYEQHSPNEVNYGEWHLPYVTKEEKKIGYEPQGLALASSMRCGRVSFLTHEGKTNSINEDCDAAFEKLLTPGHMSPFEHPATPLEEPSDRFCGNFKGWKQYRKFIPGESDRLGCMKKKELTES